MAAALADELVGPMTGANEWARSTLRIALSRARQEARAEAFREAVIIIREYASQLNRYDISSQAYIAACEAANRIDRLASTKTDGGTK